MSREELLDQLVIIAKAAGEAIREVYNSDDFAVEEKQDDDFVSPLTKADKQASEIIVTKLGEISQLPIVSEENTVRQADDTYWLVDPLDGTKEFIKRGGDFTVNIALIENNTPTMGVVYAPVPNVTYTGDVEAGKAFKETAEGKKEIQSEADTTNPIVVASKSHRNQETEDFLAALPTHQAKSIGSSLKLCLVAEGEAMLYPRLGPTSLWDTAAADAVVRAAGGMTTTLSGEPLAYDINKEILNPFFVVASKNNVLQWNKSE